MSALSKTASARTDARRVREAFQHGVDVAESDSKWQAFKESKFAQNAKGAAKGFGNFIKNRTAGIRGDFAAMYYAVHERHAYKKEQKKINKYAAWLEERGIKLDESERFANRMDMNEYLRSGNKTRFNPYGHTRYDDFIDEYESKIDREAYDRFVQLIQDRYDERTSEWEALSNMGFIHDEKSSKAVYEQMVQRDVDRNVDKYFSDGWFEGDSYGRIDYTGDRMQFDVDYRHFRGMIERHHPELLGTLDNMKIVYDMSDKAIAERENQVEHEQPVNESPSAQTGPVRREAKAEPSAEEATAKTYTEALEARAKAFEEKSQALDAEMEAEFQKFAAKYQNKYQSLVTEYDDVIKAKSQPATNTKAEQKSEPDASASTNDESKVIFRYTRKSVDEDTKKLEARDFEFYVNTATGSLTYDCIEGDKHVREQIPYTGKEFEQLYKQVKGNAKGEYEIVTDFTGENKAVYDKYCKSTKTVFAYNYEHNDGDEIYDDTCSYRVNTKTGSFVKVSTDGRDNTTITKATVDELNADVARVDKEIARQDRLRAQGDLVRGGYSITSKFTDENKALVNEVISPATKKAKAMDKAAKMDAAKAEAKEEAKTAKKARRTSKKTSQLKVEATQAEQPKAIEAKATTEKAPEAKPVEVKVPETKAAETKSVETKETFAEAKPVETSAVAVPAQEANGKQGINFIGMIKSSFGLASEALGAISQFQDKKASMKQSTPQIIDGGSYTEIEDKESKRSDRVAQIGDAIPVENALPGPTEQALLPAGV